MHFFILKAELSIQKRPCGLFYFLRGLFLGQFFLALLGQAHDFAFVAFDQALVHEQVPDRVRALGAVLDPIFDAVLLDVEGDGIGAGVEVAQDFQGLAPRVATLFHDYETVFGLFLLADAGETDRKHNRNDLIKLLLANNQLPIDQ